MIHRQRCKDVSVLTKFRYKISHQLNNVFSFRFTHRENLTTWLVWSRLILAMTRHLEIITLLVWIRLLIQTQTTRAHLPLAGCVKIIHFRHTPFKLNKPAVLNWERERCYRVPENWKKIHWWTYFSISSFPHCLIWRTWCIWGTCPLRKNFYQSQHVSKRQPKLLPEIIRSQTQTFQLTQTSHC